MKEKTEKEFQQQTFPNILLIIDFFHPLFSHQPGNAVSALYTKSYCPKS